MSEAWSSVRQDTALLQRLQQRKQHAHEEAAFFGGGRPRTSAITIQQGPHQQKLRVSRLLHTSKGRPNLGKSAAAKQQRSATAGSLWAPLVCQNAQQAVTADARGAELSASLRAAAGESTLPTLQWVDFFTTEASSAAVSNSWDDDNRTLLKSMQQLGNCKAHSTHCGCVNPGSAARFKVCL
jgi:hypothetical protein